ncbi:MAG: Crp/Fnr family transcriptional regulator [Pseudomonadota bacterium]
MSKTQQKLIAILKQLNDTDQASVMSFAKFLVNNSKQDPSYVKEPEVLQKPLDMIRPEKENVVIAIKRLSATYPMIKSSSVLDHAAKLMTDHLMHGKQAKLAIDELEILFSEHYERYCQTFSNNESN